MEIWGKANILKFQYLELTFDYIKIKDFCSNEKDTDRQQTEEGTSNICVLTVCLDYIRNPGTLTGSHFEKVKRYTTQVIHKTERTDKYKKKDLTSLVIK